MKKLNLIKVKIIWGLEKLSRKIWEKLTDGQKDHWFDHVPAYFFRKRKEAEKYYWDKYKENIYGEK